jgi:hypothetical protein
LGRLSDSLVLRPIIGVLPQCSKIVVQRTHNIVIGGTHADKAAKKAGARRRRPGGASACPMRANDAA